MKSDNNPRFSVAAAYFKRGYQWIDWSKVPREIQDKLDKGVDASILDEYVNIVPTEVIIMLLKEFQNDTGLIGKIMQEEIYSKDMSRRHLDIIEKLIDVVGGKK